MKLSGGREGGASVVIGLLIFYGTFPGSLQSKILAALYINSFSERTRGESRTSKQRFVKFERRTETYKGALGTMATYRDPVSCFAPLEVIERLLEIRAEAGFAPVVYLLSPDYLADYLDAFGFDVYAFSEAEAIFHFGDYRAPGGDHAHCSLTTH